MRQMFVVLLFVAACYAAPKHESNRQALDDEGWKAYLGEMKVFVETVPTTTSQSVDGPDQSTTTTTTTFKTTVKKFLIVKETLNWDSAKSSCESIGGKLAEPKTEKQARFLGTYMDDGIYWIGGTCSNCIKSYDDKWEWVSGGHISLSHPMWNSYSEQQMPYDEGSHDSRFGFFLALARNSLSGNELTFVNYNGLWIHGYICELA